MDEMENSNLDFKKNDDVDETVSSFTENTDETLESKASSSDDDETNDTVDKPDIKCGIKRDRESDSDDQSVPSKIPKNDSEEEKDFENLEDKDAEKKGTADIQLEVLKSEETKNEHDDAEIKCETPTVEVKQEIESPLASPVSSVSQTSQASSIVKNSPLIKSPGSMEATRQSIRANRNSNPAACLIKKPKPPMDMSNPLYKVPFKYGWRRELVYRANTDANDTKRNGDIYYFTPDGKKVRSMREVIENLRNRKLSTDNFTFYKEPIGMDNPEFETVRVAKRVKAATPNQSKSSKKKEKSSVEPLSPITFGKSSKPKIGGFKVKLQGARLSQGKRPNQVKSEKKSSLKSPLQIGTLPPGWQGSSKSKFGKSVGSSKSKKLKKSISSPKLQPTPIAVPVTSTDSAPPVVVAPKRKEYMKNFLGHVSVGYVCLMHVFQYLKMQELLRASRVCRMWRDLANHPSLWEVVRLKNSKVTDWDAFVSALSKHQPRTLDLRKMLTSGNDNKNMWSTLLEALPKIESLTRIDLCRCPSEVVEKLPQYKPNLEVFTASSITCQKLNISSFDKFVNLQELRLRSNEGIELTQDLTPFKDLPLKHLSLTSVRSLGKKNIELIGTFTQLESLELGDCDELPENFGSEILIHLKQLERIRLEKGPQTSCTYNILKAIGDLPKVEQLELVNFDVKTGFDEAIAACTNIKKLLLIPTYISQSATTNHTVLNGVAQLTSSLTCFIWGVTMELLRVTELFVDQCDHTPNKKSKDSNSKKNKKTNESIPILKPVPLIFDDETRSSNSGQVEILPISTLEMLLAKKLSSAKVSILRVPYHATWRQSIADCIQ